MSRLFAFLRNASGASAAEFAMILPLALLVMFGIVDVGRYTWELNQAEKAVQMGARYAVATRLVAQGLNNWDDYQCNGAAVEKGDRICRAALGTISCTAGGGGGATCTCAAEPCPSDLTADGAAFANIVSRMRVFAPRLRASDVTVRYSGSGIGYAADPALDDAGNPLSDIAPIVTVEASGLNLRAMLLLGGHLSLPGAAASLTLEDGDGQKAY